MTGKKSTSNFNSRPMFSASYKVKQKYARAALIEKLRLWDTNGIPTDYTLIYPEPVTNDGEFAYGAFSHSAQLWLESRGFQRFAFNVMGAYLAPLSQYTWKAAHEFESAGMEVNGVYRPNVINEAASAEEAKKAEAERKMYCAPGVIKRKILNGEKLFPIQERFVQNLILSHKKKVKELEIMKGQFFRKFGTYPKLAPISSYLV